MTIRQINKQKEGQTKFGKKIGTLYIKTTFLFM